MRRLPKQYLHVFESEDVSSCLFNRPNLTERLSYGCNSYLSLQGTSVSLNTSISSTIFSLEIMGDIIRTF